MAEKPAPHSKTKVKFSSPVSSQVSPQSNDESKYSSESITADANVEQAHLAKSDSEFSIDTAKYWLNRGLSAGQLAAALGGEVVDVVEKMHGTISRRPLPWKILDNDSTRGLTKFVYGCVKAGFDASHWSLKQLSQATQMEEEDPRLIPAIAILNGVAGDSLVEKDNQLAIQMTLIPESMYTAAMADTSIDVEADNLSSKVQTQKQQQQQQNTCVIFMHGLCMSEFSWWQNKSDEHGNSFTVDDATLVTNIHHQFVQNIKSAHAADIFYLRYNTGLHVSQNGKLLSDLITAETADYQRIIIIGHSMGGLITRSAMHYAQNNTDAVWINKVSHVAMLGTPHNGAPLERLGNWANTLLGKSPYSKALMALGDLRSAGIRDLRHGNLLSSDWENVDFHFKDDPRTPVPLLDHVQYLLVAATRSTKLPESPYKAKHDLLVTVASAWGQSKNANRTIDQQNPNVQRKIFVDTDHMQLQRSQPIYACIEQWLTATS